MRNSRQIVLGIVVAGLAWPASGAGFETQVRERLTAYETVRTEPAGYEAALTGHYEDSTMRLETLVPDAEKTAADHFVLGNMLYDVDPDRSFAHHRAALALRTDEPLLWIEIAYQHHRRGDCKEALPYYERAADRGRLHPPQYALLAHCLVGAGRYADALEAWTATDYPSRHTAVDFTIHDVFGELSPLARHDALMKRVMAGDRAAVGDLFENAISWRRDWWNSGKPNREAFEAALAAVERKFGAGDSLVRELRIWEASFEADSPEVLCALLAREGLIIDEGKLPQSSFVARMLLTSVARRRIESVANLADRFMSDIDRRARGGPAPDPDALILLGAFVAETGTREELLAVDRYGWKQYRNADFAYDLLQKRAAERGDAFTHEDPLLVEAVADFPDDSRFALLLLARAIAGSAATPAQVASLIEAEYNGLRTDDAHYSRALKRYYTELARRLPESAPAAPATAD